MANYLSHPEILELNQAILDAGMNTPTIRDYLLQNIHRGFVAGLIERDNAYFQIQSDLSELNGVEFLIGDEPGSYEVPLQIWLLNGVTHLRIENKPQRRIFQKRLEKVTAKSEEIILADKGEAPRLVPEVPELIIHEDNLLAYGWLRGAIMVGDSVARLTVPRYQNGQSIKLPGKDEPMLYNGTGWLIGKQYLITNHHVVNARSPSESDASEADLHLQAQNTSIAFKYDSMNMEGIRMEVESLEAWWPRHKKPKLDYAVLKLKTPSDNDVLTLASSALDQLATILQQPELSKPAVNIIQHPGGGAKKLGVRNNLVSVITDSSVDYFTDTEQGSSGSPVCTDNWEVIALHRAGAELNQNVNFQGKDTGYVNKGVRIDLIIKDLEDNHGDLWQAINATVI